MGQMSLTEAMHHDEVRALRAEVARLQTANAVLRGYIALDELKLNPSPPMPSLMIYDGSVDDVVAAIRRRGIHASEIEWLADYIQRLADH